MSEKGKSKTSTCKAAGTFLQFSKCILSEEDEIRYIRQYQETGCEKSRKILVDSFGRLVVNIASRRAYARSNCIKKVYQNLLEEYIGVGMLTLVRCIDLYDHTHGNRFSTYLYRAVQSRLTDYILKNCSLFRPPVYKLQDYEDIPTGIYDEFDESNVPSVEQIVERQLPDLSVLDERQRYIIEQHYLEDKTLKDLGVELDVTRERVRQLKNKALEKLRSVYSEDSY